MDLNYWTTTMTVPVHTDVTRTRRFITLTCQDAEKRWFDITITKWWNRFKSQQCGLRLLLLRS